MKLTRRPKLTVILVAYDMARELPRTLYTLSPQYQHGLQASDYEVIVVDNASPAPVDKEGMRQALPNGRVLRLASSNGSPCAAINKAIGQARGDLVGVMIDGARMASPGLLATAIQASRVDGEAAVGTIAFHLGPKVQMESVQEGYNQEAEDALLETVDWRADGYRLFDISVLARSSAGGWFALPSETNALFMSKVAWNRLGGFDERFVSPGGGIVNPDTWKRVCESSVHVVMLVGEATFHQVHGGVATNSPTHNEVVARFFDEYKAIRGHDYQPPSRRVFYYGTIPPVIS